MALQFRTAYIAPSSRVFGRGELVIDPVQIAQRYLRRFFFIDLFSVLPLPHVVIWSYLNSCHGTGVLSTKTTLLKIVMLQFLPRATRVFPLLAELRRTSGAFAESNLLGATFYLLCYMIFSHVIGAIWYLLAVEHQDNCWHLACENYDGCSIDYFYCGNQYLPGYDKWHNASTEVLGKYCSLDTANQYFNFGIYRQALTSEVVSTKKFFPKFCYCLWWGLQNLSTLGQGLVTSTYVGEVLFSICLAIGGLILFALTIGNMQTYLSSMTVRIEEMRVKRRDLEGNVGSSMCLLRRIGPMLRRLVGMFRAMLVYSEGGVVLRDYDVVYTGGGCDGGHCYGDV